MKHELKKVLGLYRSDSAIGRLAAVAQKNKVVKVRQVEKIAKADKVAPMRLARRFNRHGKARKAWSFVREGNLFRTSFNTKRVAALVKKAA